MRVKRRSKLVDCWGPTLVFLPLTPFAFATLSLPFGTNSCSGPRQFTSFCHLLLPTWQAVMVCLTAFTAQMSQKSHSKCSCVVLY